MSPLTVALRSLYLLFHPSRLIRKKRLKAPGRPCSPCEFEPKALPWWLPYLSPLADCWGPFSHRPSATKPITSHEAVWPCQGQPCSVPASSSRAANLLSFLTRQTQMSLAMLATRTRSARCASRAATSSFRAESRATGRNWIWSPGESWPTRSRSAEMTCAT